MSQHAEKKGAPGANQGGATPTANPHADDPVKLREQFDAMRAELGHKSKDLEEYASHLKRLQADFENYMKRAEKDRASIQEFATERLVSKLLIALDEFERAMDAMKASGTRDDIVKGVELVFKNLHKTLEAEGVKPIDAVGKQFDPYKHEVLLQAPKDGAPDGLILEELQKGYEMKGKVIRYSKVKVVKNPSDQGKKQAN
jgi:molecular chaperone GrpE